ncbi:MAG TPA: helix-turn-helix domain-containing protein [Novosphingobium sp.]
MGDLRESEDAMRCGLPLALEAMGERWSFMILRAAFNGVCHFEEFLSVLGIARNILSNRLAKLVDHGIMCRDPCAHDRRMVEYRLTDKGVDLLPSMLALRQWGEKYGLGVPSNPVLVDCRDHLPIAPMEIRAHDGRAIAWSELQWLDRSLLGQGAPCPGPAELPALQRKR